MVDNDVGVRKGCKIMEIGSAIIQIRPMLPVHFLILQQNRQPVLTVALTACVSLQKEALEDQEEVVVAAEEEIPHALPTATSSVQTMPCIGLIPAIPRKVF